MADSRQTPSHPQSARTSAILDDLRQGHHPADIARAHGVTVVWVRFVRRRAGLPPYTGAVRRATNSKRRTPSPRTTAILADLTSGMKGLHVAARHGVSSSYVYKLKKRLRR